MLLNCRTQRQTLACHNTTSLVNFFLRPLARWSYSTTGTVSLPIPPSVQLPIPEIAFKIPDLEAVAQIVLRRVENGEVAGMDYTNITFVS
jgi:hypothetical protein